MDQSRITLKNLTPSGSTWVDQESGVTPSFIFFIAKQVPLTNFWKVSFQGHTIPVLAINCMTVQLCSMGWVSFRLVAKENAMYHSSTLRIAAKINHCKQRCLLDYVKVLPDTTTRTTIRGLKWCNSPE